MKQAVPASDLLGERVGVSDDIAVLRRQYPRDGWRTHASFGQLADFWLGVHAALRHEGDEVSRVVDAFRERRIDAAAFRRAFVPRLNGFLQHLDQHHRIEDHAYFPKFRQLDPKLVAGFDLLEADHALIQERLVATVDHARKLLEATAAPGVDCRGAVDGYVGAAGTLIDLLQRHLDDEEDLVIPALLHHGERPLL
ncbi:hemerythrin domain-containing protein [Sphingomonas baiyangensis]|uniref:Hemerythrin domain-containing protein n=1 Tax=Sphingomonas baiyangensis TaxID=2572576 RepID=A0A4V5PUV3_9SPHN|nr:hemerythrin domain-containing protein [Sphingomonas baiyangensis]TKD51618.1 hemerythrin domain-containing protein [Sphingomonas baiyangensis]